MERLLCIFTVIAVSTCEIRDLYWREYIDGNMPPDAVEASPGLYIGQIPVNGIVPATIYPNNPVAVSEYDGKKVEAEDAVKILCGNRIPKIYWEHVNAESLTPNKLNGLVRGGFEGGQLLYIGRCFHEGEWKIGKVFPADHALRGLQIWTKSGGSYTASDFEVLKHTRKKVVLRKRKW